MSTCRPVNLSTRVDMPRDKYMTAWHYGFLSLFTCRLVNLSTSVDRSRGLYRSAGHYGLFLLVHLTTGKTVKAVNGLVSNGSRYYNVLAFAILSSLLPSYIYVDLSTSQKCYAQGNIWSIHSIVGGGVLGACPPPPPPPPRRRRIASIALCCTEQRGDLSRGKYRSTGHYGYSVPVHLSTCQPVNLSTRLDMSRGKYIISSHYG